MKDEVYLIFDALKDVKPKAGTKTVMETVDCCQVDFNANNNISGEGMIATCMGYYYQGNTSDGVLEGDGSMKWADGCVITGEFKDGLVNGVGSIQWANKDYYEGSLLNNVRHGEGKLTTGDQKCVYVGEWYHGCREGRGKQVYADGSTFEGEWKQDQRHGKGLLRFQNGDCYDGNWEKGVICGEGVMGWKHGGTAYAELYDGEWKDGVPHGHGRSTYIRVVDSDEEGAIPCDSPVDFAPAVNAVVNVYVGQHCQGQRDGVGVFYYADGSTYEGEWKAGKKCGSGSFTTSIGTLVKGTYENDELVGGEERHADPIDMSLVPEVFISDMCGLSDGSLEQLNATMNSLLLRYNTVLKTLFSQYCVKKEDVTFINTDKNWWKLRLPGQITIPQFLRLLSDNRIINGPVTLSTVLRCVVHTLDVFERQNGNREGSEAYAQRRKDIYELKGTINYRTFTECLVRLAPHVCVGSTFVTLGDKFNAMMEANFSLSEHPVCPLTRKYEDALRPLAGDLIDLFNTLVDLELNNGERFLPVRSFITLIAGVLAEHKTEVGAVVQYMFPYNLYSDEVNVPPGINQPHTMLNYQLYRTSCGAQETNLVASVCSTLLLTMVDFIEALVKLAYELCVTAAPGSIDENIVNFIRSKILTLNPM